MAVESGATSLGASLPDVTLPDLHGTPVSLTQLRGDRVLVVVFSANHCPYVQHLERRLGEVAAGSADSDVRFVAVGSNDVSTYPDDDVAGLAEQASRAGWRFPYLIDADQSVAKQFGAVCTPDFFVFASDGTLAYRGAFDASSPKNDAPLTGDLLQAVIEAAVAGQPIRTPHRPAMGCGIKWLPGNEPEAVSFV